MLCFENCGSIPAELPIYWKKVNKTARTGFMLINKIAWFMFVIATQIYLHPSKVFSRYLFNSWYQEKMCHFVVDDGSPYINLWKDIWCLLAVWCALSVISMVYPNSLILQHHFDSSCSSCGSSLVSLEVFYPVQILLIVQTTHN